MLDTLLKLPSFRVADPLKPFRKFFTGMQKTGKESEPFDNSELARRVYEENQYFIDAVKAGADTLRDAFGEAWRDIFGEANSLFEKLMQNILNSIATNFTERLAGSFINMLIPGSATLLGLPMFKSNSNPTVIINQMGDEEVSRVVVKGINQAQRLGVL